MVAGAGGSGTAGKGGTSAGGANAGGTDAGGSTAAGTGGAGIEIGGAGGGGVVVDPKTCAEAAQQKSYIGCDFWPTVTPNSVWDVFDYAVVVANAGEQPSTVTVTRGDETFAEETVEPNELKTIYLPWVKELKGADGDNCGSAPAPTKSVLAKGGAYHLQTTNPVTVYQFNALEYAPKGGPAGKDWSKCPGNTTCTAQGRKIGCFSYTNDASLLLPSTAMTGNYRIATMKTFIFKDQLGQQTPAGGAYFVVTATQPGTTSVDVQLAPNAGVVGGTEFVATEGGELISFTLEQGDAITVLGKNALKSDLSGSLVQADKAVQVIVGMPCVQLPFGSPACDHIEESVFPVETLGKKYIVTRPSGPTGEPVPHMVRIFGNVDDTTLTFPGGAPKGTPNKINAGEVIELDGGKGDLLIRGEFEIEGDHEFSVAIFLLGGTVVDPAGPFDINKQSKGDPSQSMATAVEQYRTKYVFLAPADYDKSFVDIIQPVDATVNLDGKDLTQTPAPIPGDPAYGVIHVELGPGQGGAHVIEATAPVGIQVLGYGAYTSYHYPGGSNLISIAPPPPPVK